MRRSVVDEAVGDLGLEAVGDSIHNVSTRWW
jgi:hypothetical protein